MSKKKALCVCSIICVFLIIIFGISLVLNGVSSLADIFKNNKALENTYYLSQIICSFILLIGGFVGIWQYSLSKIAEKNQYHNSRVQKAIDLSEYYKDNILCNMTFILDVYERLGIFGILDNVKIENMKDFDIKELNDIFTPKDIKIIKQKLDSGDLIRIVNQLSEIYTKTKIYSKELIIKEGNTYNKVIGVNRDRIYEEFINNTVMETLNNLEYFALHFVYDTADKKVVYQSLHKTYLEIVKLLYYNIAINNATGEKKLYTNVIDLFNTWKEMAVKQKQNEIQSVRENLVTGEKARNIE